ncbi:MAG: CPBP family intramembrane glutamic endopeptidase [Isosphaeraceae bacterium]
MLAEILPTLAAKVLLVLFGLAVLTGTISAWSIVIARWSQGTRLLPAIKVHGVPWGTVAIMAIVPIWALTQLLAVMLYGPIRRLAGFGQRGNGELSNFDKIALVGLINAALLWVIPAFLRRCCGARWSDLGLPGRPIVRNLLHGIGLCFLILPFVYAVMAIMTRFFPAREHPAALALVDDTSPLTIILMFLSAVVLAPAAEELCFRVVLLGWLTKLMTPSPRHNSEPDRDVKVIDAHAEIGADPSNLIDGYDPDQPPEAPPWTATGIQGSEPSLTVRVLPNVVTSLLFASLHIQQWPAPVALFVLSLGLGVLYRRTGSLIAPVAMHACFNGLSMTGVLLASLSGMVPDAKPPQPARAKVVSCHEGPSTAQTSAPTIFVLARPVVKFRIPEPLSNGASTRFSLN